MDDLEIVPIKKKKLSKNKYLKYGIGALIILVAIIGVSYSFFNYTGEDTRNADIASGEVYVRLVENEQNITLNKMYPRTDEEARSRNDNYFDFTIKAKNTSETKSVIYHINIENGDNVSGKTRIDSKYIKLDLQKKVNDEYVYVLEGVKLSNYSFTDLVPVNTNSEITKEYRLRIWISDDIIISDTEPDATYTQSEFANLYANFNITVNSEDKETAYSMLAKNADTTTLINFANKSSDTNGKGLYRLLGTESDNYPIYYYRGEIDNNNVVFAGYCWQIVRTTDTGGIKMIYNGLPDISLSGDNITYNCGTTRDIQDTIRTTTILQESTGYYYADDYEIVSTSGNSVTYKLKSKNNPITRVAIANAADAATNIPTIAANYPYTCKSTYEIATCTELYKVDSYTRETEANVYSSNGRTIIGDSVFNMDYTSIASVGYMNNTKFRVLTPNWTTDALFASSAIWNIDHYELTDASVTTPDETHHYSCNATTSSATCTSLRYVYYASGTTNYYITLTDGDLIEDALYKMTGNGSVETKTKNVAYNLNVNNSRAKEIIDNWFRTNLTSEVDANNPDYSVYLEDTVFCNDRSFKTTGSSNTYTQSGWNQNGGSLSTYLYFGTRNKYGNNWYSATNVPSMICPNVADKFTVQAFNGNGALTYPVGLLTADEVILAGIGGNNASTTTYYLYTSDIYWSMSPSRFNSSYSDVFYLGRTNLSDGSVNSVSGLRPVIFLKIGTEFESGGDGTPTNPYVVKYN